MKKQNHPVQWRSLNQLAGEAAAEEMPIDPDVDGMPSDAPSRRHFMQIMGASTALAAAISAGCRRWEKEEIVPEAKRPEGWIPGVPKRYASAMEVGGAAVGVLVTAYDGRPVKIEGNPQHPYLGGGSSVFAQASVLQMYDPDRSRTVMRQGTGAGWDEVEPVLAGLRADPGLRVLAEASSSPTLMRLRKELPENAWYEWEPLSRDHERAGTAMAFGTPMRPVYDLAQARVIVAVDADLFVDHPAGLAHARGFARTRRPEVGDMSRLYSIEANFTPTGAAADHRLPLRSEQVPAFLIALEQLITGGKLDKDAEGIAFLTSAGVRPFLEELAADVKASSGRALFVVGAGQPPLVHAIAARLNAQAAGNQAVRYAADPDPDRKSHAEAISALVAEINSGACKALLILGGNPVYDAPADLDFAAALKKVDLSLHLSLYQDETSAACTWHLPRAHYLESWGDALSWDGTYSVVQPVIEPLYAGRTPIELLAGLLGQRIKNGRELVRATFDGLAGNPGEAEWRRTLHDGFLGRALGAPAAPALQEFKADLRALEGRALSPLDKRANGELEVVFCASTRTHDGRFANLAWLQELPEYLSKLTWENACFVGPHTAKELGIRSKVHSERGEPHYSMVTISVGGGSVTLPAYVLPGIAKYSVIVNLGHGRTRAGRVAGSADDGVKPVGFDVYPLRSSKALWSAGGATVNPTGDTYVLASTQDHWDIDARGRQTVIERIADLARDWDPREREFIHAFEEKEQFAPDPKRGLSLWNEHTYDGYKWGMAIDLGLCIGCNACVTACQAENNVPVVGKARVLRSREMHWIRIDTYFRGDVENPQVVHQPLHCQQCENAPCEQVCPVGATVHSDEGLNDMTYNRCVGTRYCMNNCIYKVRRFNFFAYDDEQMPGGARDKVRRMLFNPEVTIRSRGVMEKCTWCVQRIQNKKIPATNEGRRLRDGEVVTACQQACPAGAIMFGDLNDKDSEVNKWHEQPRAYAMLGEFNAKPRNLFLGRVRNYNDNLVKRLGKA
jgi:Fe-S-cluster-containing dehydrogenase component/anaerobic selenocysteine-containing dehydrogenase